MCTLVHVPKVAEMVAKNVFTLLGSKLDKFQPECCEADFGSRIKILRYPLGRSASFVEIYLFRLVPAPQIEFFEKPIS